MATNETKNKPFGDVTYHTARAEAIEDGSLIDVTETACEAGIAFPTALTAAVWQCCVKYAHKINWRDERDRLWEVLAMLRYAIIRSSAGDRQIAFSVVLHDETGRLRRTDLKALCGPDDAGEPVITILMPDEN